ncbi:MAG TPA: metalloregulator ArsR/SmtB family transcription factor [Flavisolibacter sp.]|nr:metalloregulator ArsR/SmtB family transcription factor [Flavisolibacter sp.]
MGITKSEIFTDKQNKMATMLKALAHPARIAIVEYLINAKSCICGDLVEELGLAQATVSQHLKELKTAGIIKGTVDGASICYCIDEKVWKQTQEQMQKFFVSYELKNNCC